ncbi:hypothetical protein [Psychromonas sp. KJ10-2]|uniref:hypothetical protein n=1 Tax=Psychromonas sp. KJ10-2 TaxID=3391822 RepID=UPI0039B6C572
MVMVLTVDTGEESEALRNYEVEDSIIKHHLNDGEILKKDSLRCSNKLSASLRSFVQADRTVRARTTTRGTRLNSKVLHRGAINDPRLFKTKKTVKKVDSIVDIVLDKSGSMYGQFYDAKIAVKLTLPCVRYIARCKCYRFCISYFHYRI